MGNPFFEKDVLSIKDFARSDIEFLFKATDRLQNAAPETLRNLAAGHLLALLFFEPSTRTRLSFEAAMLSVGGHALGFAEPQMASVQKGENLADTVRTVEAYVDLIVLRHPMEGAARFAAEMSAKPLINAGSGTEEHPTQAMLDLYTIYREKGRVDGLRIAVVGDLKYGRTVYSLLYGLSKFGLKECFLISPQQLKLRREALFDLEGKMRLSEHEQLEPLIPELDVLYVTRIQKERFPDPHEYERVKGTYVVSNEVLQPAQPDLIVMHPLPRVGEIAPDVDATPRAKYFLQTYYGKMVRAALIASVVNERGVP